MTAYIVIGDAGFKRETVLLGKTKFAKGSLDFINSYKEYIEVLGDRFRI